jgi:hypothetical protein
MNATVAEQHEPSMCYRQASRGWAVYFAGPDGTRHEGVVTNVAFSTGRRTSVEVVVPGEGDVHRRWTIRNGSLESKTFRSED